MRCGDDPLANAREIERLESSGIGESPRRREQLQESSFSFRSWETISGSAFPREVFMT
jgi:hypothetical protein